MSGPLMKQFMDTKDLWTSAQAATMSYLCWHHREDVDYAEVSANDVAHFIGVGRRRVFTIYEQLEALLAITRLEPGDRGQAHSGKPQKIAVTLNRALARAAAGDASSTNRVVIPGSAGWCRPDHHPDDLEITRVMSPATSPDDPEIITGGHQDLRRKFQEYKAKEAAARLPLLGPLPSDHPRVAESLRQAQAHQDRKLKNRVRGLARAILFNPSAGAHLIHGEAIATLSSLIAAVKEVCRNKARQQPYLQAYGTVVDGICASEFFKHRNPDVLAGRAPRPRDLSRKRRR